MAVPPTSGPSALAPATPPTAGAAQLPSIDLSALSDLLKLPLAAFDDIKRVVDRLTPGTHQDTSFG